MNTAFPAQQRSPLGWAFLVAAFCGAALTLQADPPEGTLIWNNGETLKGHLAAGEPNTLGWQAEVFQQPLSLRLYPLRRVEFSGEDEMTKEPFAVFMTDGSRLHGEIVAVDGETLTLRSQRHGTVLLTRSGVLRIQRLNGEGLFYAGPCGAARWSAMRDASSGRSDVPLDVPHTGRGGVMIAPGWNHRAALNLCAARRGWTFSSG